MNKLVKVISILLIALMVVAVMPQNCFAAPEATTAISTFVSGQGYESSEISSVKSIAQRVLVAVRNIAIIAAVLIISILGVKYMLGSVEEKPGYTKAFMPLIVGAILVVSAAQIATMLFSLN